MYSHTPNYIDAETGHAYMEVLEQGMQWAFFAPSPKSRMVSAWCGEKASPSGMIISSLLGKLESDYSVRVAGVFLNLVKTTAPTTGTCMALTSTHSTERLPPQTRQER